MGLVRRRSLAVMQKPQYKVDDVATLQKLNS